MTTVHVYGLGADGQWSPMLNTGLGTAVGGGGGSASASQPASWKYTALSGGITDTNDVTLVAAAGAQKSNYITNIDIMNSSATATEVVIKDGSTVIWRTKVGASMIAPVSIALSLASTSNTALKAACITTSTATYINAQGYQDYSPLDRLDAVTPYDELQDDLGGNIFDNSSSNNQIYAVA
jgi:hypothetical protein